MEFLSQFPPLPESNQNLSFFGLTSAWVEQHKPEPFGFLLGFLVGDAGKYYSEYETRARHYAKSAITTNMANIDSNIRLLRYVQMTQDCIGIRSHQISGNGIIRWNSESSNLVTWMIRACLGLKSGERTSRNPIKMPWLSSCPREFIVAFLQGLAESDGYVSKTRDVVEIASVPNSELYSSLIEKLGFASKAYKLKNPTFVRTTIQIAGTIPLYNSSIHSYRYEHLLRRQKESQTFSPPPFFSTVDAYYFERGRMTRIGNRKLSGVYASIEGGRQGKGVTCKGIATYNKDGRLSREITGGALEWNVSIHDTARIKQLVVDCIQGNLKTTAGVEYEVSADRIFLVDRKTYRKVLKEADLKLHK